MEMLQDSRFAMFQNSLETYDTHKAVSIGDKEVLVEMNLVSKHDTNLRSWYSFSLKVSCFGSACQKNG